MSGAARSAVTSDAVAHRAPRHVTHALLGRCRCPECAYPDAEVRTDKNGDPYRYCEDCGAQYFTRGEPVKMRNLIACIRPASTRAARGPAPAASSAMA